MALELIYITNDPVVAKIAENNGVDYVMVDLETLGKEDRQRNMNTVKSNHTVDDISRISKVLSKAKLLVRVNPWNEGSVCEINEVISRGADVIMLPMWKSVAEVNAFLTTINERVKSILLLETKEAVECADEVLEDPRVERVHIGLNDLHLSYGMTFMFEPLSSGLVDALCQKCREKGIKYGFGGIARIGEGTLPAEKIVMEHYRLGSSIAILSRSFCNAMDIQETRRIEAVFTEHISKLRQYEEQLSFADDNAYLMNRDEVIMCVHKIVQSIKEKRKCEKT